MKGFNEQFKKFKVNVGASAKPVGGVVPPSAPITTDKHDNSLVLLQAKLSEEIRQHMKEMSTAFAKQMKATNAWVDELKNVGALAETWGQHFSGQSGSQQLAASLKRLAEFNKIIANSMSSVAKFIEVGMIGPQRQFVKSDIKAARQVKKKYDRAKHEVLSAEEAVESLQKANKPTVEAEGRVNTALSTFREISDEAVTAITHTNETADCNSVEISYSYLETHRSMFLKGSEWLTDVQVEFKELKEYVTTQKAELARSAPSTPDSYGQRRVFGVSVEELASREGGGWASTTAPSPISDIIAALHGALTVDGLFRMSPEHAVLERPRVAIDRGDRVDFTTLDPHVLTGLLKKYLRSMPQPLLGRFYRQWTVVPSLEEPERTHACQKLLCDLPPVNLALLIAIVRLCAAINAESASNRMNFSNLAIVFAPCILFDMSPQPTADPRAAALEMANAQKVVELLLSSTIAQTCATMPSRPRSSPRSVTAGSPSTSGSIPSASLSNSSLSSSSSSSSSPTATSPVASSPIASSLNFDGLSEVSPRGIKPSPPVKPAHMTDAPTVRGRPPVGTPPRHNHGPGHHSHPLPSPPSHPLPSPPSQPLPAPPTQLSQPSPPSPLPSARRGVPIALARQIVAQRGHD